MRRALSFSAAAVVLLVSAQASASFHLTKVVEVFAGSATAPNASYVQLQAYAANQNFVGGHILHVYDSAGVEIVANQVIFAGNVPNGSDQSNILIGTTGVQAAFGVAPDFTLPQNLVKAGGAVCFDGIPEDCFSWGNYAPAAAPDTSVSPFAALTVNKAARRSIAGGLSPTLLEAADDGNNNALDFAAVDPAPKNNIGPASGDAGTDASVPGVDASTPHDSGIGTTPSPNNPVVPADAGTGAPASAPSGDSGGGCSVVTEGSEGWSGALGLAVAGSILVLSRRRRAAKRA